MRKKLEQFQSIISKMAVKLSATIRDWEELILVDLGFLWFSLLDCPGWASCVLLTWFCIFKMADDEKDEGKKALPSLKNLTSRNYGRLSSEQEKVSIYNYLLLLFFWF